MGAAKVVEAAPPTVRAALVVDADHESRRDAFTALRRRGVRVLAASSVDEARALLSSGKVDTVLLSLAGSGRGMVDEVRLLSGAARIVAVAPEATERAQELATAAGFDGLITTPFDETFLAQTVARPEG